MELLISLVAVKKITCNSPRSLFAEENIEEAAKLILASEGVINPIVVRRTSLKSYEVVDGEFEYYAAARAREIDPKKGEMIGVFIIEEDNEELLTQQVKAFRKNHDTSPDKMAITEDTLRNFLKQLEFIVDKSEKLREEGNKLERENKDLRKQLNDKQILELFNSLDVTQMALKLKSAGIQQGDANKIADAVVAERKKQKFESFKDIVDRAKNKQGNRAMSETRMLKIVDSWLNGS